MSQPIVQGAPQQPNINLRTDFGHSPVGKFGDRDVSVGSTPTQSRTQNPPVLGKAPSLGERFLNWITPSGVRADSKARQSLHDYSEQLSKTLGTIATIDASTTEGKAKIQAALHDLAPKASKLIGQGIDYNDIFNTQLDLKLSQLSQDQLAALNMGLATALSEGGIDPQTLEGQTLGVISDKVKSFQKSQFTGINDQIKSQVESKLGGTVDKIIDHLNEDGDRDKLGQLFETLDQQATSIAEKYGPSKKDSPEGFEKFKAGLLKEALQHAIGDEPTRVGKFMGSMPPDMLKSLVHADPIYSSVDDVFAAERFVAGQIGLRAEKAEEKVLELAEKLASHSLDPMEDETGPIHSPSSFAKEVIEFQKALRELTSHSDKFGLLIDKEVRAKIDETVEHLDDLLEDGQMTLSELSTSQFGGLRGALKALDIHGLDEAFKGEFGVRREQAVKSYNQSLSTVLTSAKSGDHEQLLKDLDSFTSVTNQVLEAFRATGDKIEGSDDLMRLRYRLLDEHLFSLSDEDLISLFGAMNTTEMRTLAGGMQDVANQALNQNPVQGPKFFTASIDLELLRESITTELDNRGIGVPKLPDEKLYTAEDLSVGQLKILKDVYGMTVEPTSVRYTSGVAPEFVQKNVEKELQTRIGQTLTPETIGEDKHSTGVVGPFYRDLGRADFRIDFGDGKDPVEMVNRERIRSLDTRTLEIRKEAGIDQLRRLLGPDHDPGLLLFISDTVHQGMFTGIQASCLGPDSPIKLEDGTGGYLPSTSTELSYVFSKDDEGNIHVKATYVVKNPRHLACPPDPHPIPVDPTRSGATFTFGITITPDKQIELYEPVHIEYSAVRDTWKNPDTLRPIDIDDALYTTEYGISQGFEEYCNNNFQGESIRGVRAIDEFLAMDPPTLEKARELQNRYTRSNSEFELNISGRTRTKIDRFLRDLTDETFDPVKARALFKQARDEVVGMLKFDVLPRYLAGDGDVSGPDI